MADLTISANAITLVSGPSEYRVLAENAGAGVPVYVTGSTGTVGVADSNVDGKQTVRGITVGAGSMGDTVQVALPGAVLNLGATLGVGTLYSLSTNAGKIQPVADLTTGETVSLLGAGQTAALFLLNIWNTGIVHA